ncbi:NACHT domain-containing protein [Kordia sp.]|uniref:NACHT domain-containing protein n=1 Tax=Kordia sp. TaxID=1965332 RepID=UPI003D6BD390
MDVLRRLCKELQDIPENELTLTIIKPLFEKMGFIKVEFYGGTDEEGKDLLIWENDNFEELRLSVAQVKHFKFSNSAGNSKSLQTIVNQLTMCFKKNIHYSDKSIHSPFEVILISSFEIDSKNIKSRFDMFPDLLDRKIRIIDGIKLAQLLIRHCPSIVNNLIDTEIDFSHYSTETLNNEILLKALGFDSKIPIKSIYTDIDFSLGKSSTKLFFNNSFSGEDRKFFLDQNDWEIFRKKTSMLPDELIDSFIDLSIKEIEFNFNKEIKEYDEWIKIKKQKEKEFSKLKTLLLKLAKTYPDYIESYKNKLVALDVLEKKKSLTKKNQEKINNLKKDIKLLRKNIEPWIIADLNLKKLEKEAKPYFNDDEINYPLYEFKLNGKKLGIWLEYQKKIILRKLDMFNKTKPTTIELREYMNHCSKIFNISSILLNTDEFIECLGFDKSILFRLDFNKTRFKLSIDKVFDTGINLTLLGHAGGGKTTSLQMYALSKEKINDNIVIWAPLSQVVENWKQNINSTKIDYKISNFDEAVCEYLRFKEVKISNYEFTNTLKNKKVTILFDGLDEAIRYNEWLPEAINFIIKKYHKNIQVIVTSRMSGSFIERLNSFTVTLLPFTREQRNQFIDKWFDRGDKNITEKIKKHFESNNGIDEITRNPLLTTTLCVLAKHKLPLPQTEITLYNDRLKLLTGYYDNVKNIKTRITTTPQNLEYLSKKIAYYLHFNNKREETINILENITINILKNRLTTDESKIALRELIDPCNILVPMSERGKYGFGHLRYQEHLAAMELVSNRGINIQLFLGSKFQWWRETLYFFAQMSDDLTWLINSIGHKILSKEYMSKIEQLVSLRPKNEIEKISIIINQYKDDLSYFNTNPEIMMDSEGFLVEKNIDWS